MKIWIDNESMGRRILAIGFKSGKQYGIDPKNAIMPGSRSYLWQIWQIIRWFPKNIIHRLDGWIYDPTEIMQAMLDDLQFGIKNNKEAK